VTAPPHHNPAPEGPRSPLAFYYHATFFLAAALLAIHAVHSFVSPSGPMSNPLLLGVQAGLALVAVVGSESKRLCVPDRRPDAVLFLGLVGLFQVALCTLTGGLSSPYFLTVACTSVFAGLTMSATRAMYVTTATASAYLLAIRFAAEESSSRSQSEAVMAVIVHVAFLYLATALSGRVARQHRDKVQELSVQSMHDPLTGLENRRSFLAKMETELVRAERFSWPITMLILDLDHFKRMNDEHGHATGDAVLVEVANLLRDNVGPGNHVAPVGADAHHGRELADRLVRAFRNRHWGRVKPGLKATVSIGVAVLQPTHAYSEPTTLIREVMERADRALYRVKQAGRDGFQVSGEGTPTGTVMAGGF
jgi:diguanylate cyclase (GGDEF)-like protein